MAWSWAAFMFGVCGWLQLFSKFGDSHWDDCAPGDVCTVQGGFWLELGEGMLPASGAGDKGHCGKSLQAQGGLHSRSLAQDVAVLCFRSLGRI